jgi:hypothetical protein
MILERQGKAGTKLNRNYCGEGEKYGDLSSINPHYTQEFL